MTVTTAPIPRPRAPQFPLEQVPRHWFANSALATHISNGANLLFPAGERFFVRSVRHYMQEIEKDPLLLEQVRGFFGQEGRHAHAHERQFDVLESQGFDTQAFLRAYEKVAFGVVERYAPPELRLSATVAAEHFTAIMAENAFRLGVLDSAHPVMRKMLLWHAAEEIEHRAVAFDVLKRVNPSYGLRMAGLAVSTLMLGSFWTAATVVLLRQDGVGPRDLLRELRAMRAERKSRGAASISRGIFARGIREYLRRDFHPFDNDNDGYAARFLAEAGMA